MFAFIETLLFSRLVGRYLSDEEYSSIQIGLAKNPEKGNVIPGSGGVRKLRWSSKGRGKRGGVRVIYFVSNEPGVIWMLTIYGKNVVDDIPAHILRKIRKEIEDE